MNFNSLITIVIVFSCLLCSNNQAFSQREKPQEQSLMDQLWFGGSVGLGFNNSQFGSQFFIGLAPMVGYKITDEWSVGPRIDLSYTHIRQPSAGQIEKLSFFNVGAAVFTRYKFFKYFFGHIESGITNIPYLDRDQNGNLIVVKEQRQTVLVGLGYTAGGGEIVLLYDLNAPENSTQLPIDFRFGFNYNF